MRTERVIIQRHDIEPTPAGHPNTVDIDLEDTQVLFDVRLSPNRRFLHTVIVEEPTVEVGGAPKAPQEAAAASPARSGASVPEDSLLGVLDASGVHISETETYFYSCCAKMGINTGTALGLWQLFMLNVDEAEVRPAVGSALQAAAIKLPDDIVRHTGFSLAMQEDGSARITQHVHGAVLTWVLPALANTWERES